MKDKLTALLDKSLRSHGVQLTNRELLPVVADLMTLFETPEVPKEVLKKEVPPVSGTELKPIPPTGG